MSKTILFNFLADKEKHKINVERTFAAPRKLVWAAWTQPALLDQWWAPHPWKTETRSMDFREGGNWHYCMSGPDGEKHYGRVDYDVIKTAELFESWDGFCDENAVLLPHLPRNKWNSRFEEHEQGTLVRIELQFASLSDLEQIVAMGFKEGFTMALGNLDALLADTTSAS